MPRSLHAALRAALLFAVCGLAACPSQTQPPIAAKDPPPTAPNKPVTEAAVDLKSSPDAAATASATVADLGTAAADLGTAKAAPGDVKEGPAADDEEKLVDETKSGTILKLDEKGRWKPLSDVTVQLVCTGEKAAGKNDSMTHHCTSTLVVKQTKDGKVQTIAERDRDLDGIDYQPAGGNDERLELSLFTLIPESQAALIVIRKNWQQGDQDMKQQSTQTLYAVKDDEIVDVLSFEAASGEWSEASRRIEKSETTLALSNKHAGGVAVLTTTTEASVQKGSRAPKVTSSTTNYIWQPEEMRFGACDKLTGKAAGVGCGRRCRGAEEFCFGKCEKLDTLKNCGACGRACRAGERCCGGRCAALDDVHHCGACGNDCGRVDSAATQGLCSQAESKTCGISCRGAHYDLDGDIKNGCEAMDTELEHRDEKHPIERPPIGCSDGQRDVLRGEILADARVHNPTPAGFATTVGAAPLYFSVVGGGGWFCQNDYEFVVRTEGGIKTPCYLLSVTTEMGTQSIPFTGEGSAVLSRGRGAYKSGSTLRVKLEKTCSLKAVGRVRFSVDYHL